MKMIVKTVSYFTLLTVGEDLTGLEPIPSPSSLRIEHTPAMALFIRRFDNGGFPDLVQEEDF
jgi:hypothetical protein